MKLVPFKTNNYTSDTHFMVSDEDHEMVIKFKWVVNNERIRNNGQAPHYIIVRHSTKEERLEGWPTNIKVHRFILGLKTKAQRSIYVDHKNSWLDNTQEGLRQTDNKNNVRYQKKQKNKLSGLPKGVTKVTNSKKNPYESRIQVDCKDIKLGRFSTPELAHEAYKKAALQYFGEYAKFV